MITDHLLDRHPYMKWILANPTFPGDEHKTRTAGNLLLLVRISILLSVLVMLIPFDTSSRVTFGALSILMWVMLYQLTYRGMVGFSGVVYVAVVWGIFMMSALYDGGVLSIKFLGGGLLTLLISSILLRVRQIFLFLTLTLLYGGVLVWLDMNGQIVSSANTISPLNRMSAVSALLVIGAGLSYLTVQSIQGALANTLRQLKEREKTEYALQESEAKYRSLINHSLQGMVIVQGQTLKFANPAMGRIVGYEPEQLIDRPLDELVRMIHPEDQQAVITHIQQCAEGLDVIQPYEHRLIHVDGQVRTVELYVTLTTYNGDGALQITYVDITETQRTRQQLRIKDSAIASALTAVAIASMDGYLTYVNAAFLKLWRLNSDSEALGRSVVEFWDSSQAALAVVVELMESGHYIGELTARRSDDTLATVELNANLVRDSKGKPLCLMASFNDITDQKQMAQFALENERLKARFQKEQERNVLVQRIISALSHDLRTPLTVISTSRDILSRYFDRMSEEKRLEKLETIGRQVQFALELLDDTVNMARGNLNEASFRPMPVHIATLCQVSVDEFATSTENTHPIRFVNQCEVQTAVLDEVLVSRILLNLLSNAVKYSPEPRPIRLELDQADEWLILRVIDQGMGIGEDDLENIFDPFFRADDVSAIRGTGLGLSIVKDCVERHQGQVHVESELGHGSTFTVELPYIPT